MASIVLTPGEAPILIEDIRAPRKTDLRAWIRANGGNVAENASINAMRGAASHLVIQQQINNQAAVVPGPPPANG